MAIPECNTTEIPMNRKQNKIATITLVTQFLFSINPPFTVRSVNAHFQPAPKYLRMFTDVNNEKCDIFIYCDHVAFKGGKIFPNGLSAEQIEFLREISAEIKRYDLISELDKSGFDPKVRSQVGANTGKTRSALSKPSPFCSMEQSSSIYFQLRLEDSPIVWRLNSSQVLLTVIFITSSYPPYMQIYLCCIAS